MDVKIQGESLDNEGFVFAEIRNAEIKKVMEDLSSIKTKYENSAKSEVNLDEIKKIIDEVNSKIKSLGIFLAFDRVGDLPVVKVVSHTGEVIKIFPPEEVGRILERVSLFFDILFKFIISQYV
jgi:FlaG protein.